VFATHYADKNTKSWKEISKNHRLIAATPADNHLSTACSGKLSPLEGPVISVKIFSKSQFIQESD